MLVIPPITITDSMVLSSTIPELDTGEVAWVSGTTYAIGDRRVVISLHKIYERLTAGAGTTSPQLDPTNWLEVGPTNKWAMFDIYRNSPSIFSGATTVVISPGVRVDSLAIMGVSIYDISISINYGGNIIYEYEAPMTARLVVDYYDYFYADFNNKPSALLTDLPPVLGATITISTSQAGSISSIVIGNKVHLGYTKRGHTNNAINFSIVERDVYGDTLLVPRRNIPKTYQTLVIPKSNLNNVIDVRNALKASPAVWSGLDDYTEEYFDSLLILGIYKNFSITLDYPEFVTGTIDLEEI